MPIPPPGNAGKYLTMAVPMGVIGMPMTMMVLQRHLPGGRNTVTPNVQVAVPQALVAVHVTILERFAGKRLPDGGEQITGPMLPTAVGVNQPTALEPHVNNTMSLGHEMMGKDPATVKESTQPLLFPKQSETETVMGWTPGPTMVPAGGDWTRVTERQLVEKQLLNWRRLGTMPEQALV
jgi:hypothetical protein